MPQHLDLVKEGYEPRFDREGTTRRVLGYITDEEHIGVGPRNTIEALSHELADDPHTIYDGDTEQLQGYLDELVEAGLVKQRKGGSYSVTKAGLVELVN